MSVVVDPITDFFNRVIEGLKTDASNKNQKIPVSSLRSEVTDNSGNLFAADYFKYLIYGRPAGKAPPVSAMLDYVDANPDRLEDARKKYKYLTRDGLAYLIGQKIAKQGTDIYEGKREGIDLLGVIDKEMPELMQTLAKNEVVKIVQALNSAIK